VLIVDLDKSNIGELLEVCHERARNCVKRSVRLTTAGEVNMRDAIGIGKPAVAGKAIEHQSQSLVAFHIAWPFEIFIEDSTHDIARRWDETSRCDLIGEFTANEPIIICEVDINFDK